MKLDLTSDSESARRLFGSLGGMEGLPPPEPEAPAWSGRFETLRIIYPGVLAALTAGLAATWLSQHYNAPVMLYALLFGMAFHFLYEEGRCIRGIEYSSKAVLRVGVALLGARITFEQILSLGLWPIVIVIAGVLTTIGFGAAVSRRLGLSRGFGVLSGGAVGICGASAALAIASVLPKSPERERDTIVTVVTVTALSTIAMIFYPMLVGVMGLDHTRAGIFIGGTIHDVAQVVGAGYAVSTRTGDVATYVKLLRVTLLLPVVFGIAMATRRASGGRNAVAPVPLFLVGFAVLVVLSSLGWLPKVAIDGAAVTSRWCLVTAIAALGMKTSFKSLVAVGWRPVALMVAETIWVAALVAVALLVFR
ncbi:MAG TPA: putative sulfate exporter family transporter [Phenylobacterium sp.]